MHLIPEAYVNWDGTDTDWLSLVLSNSILQSYNLSIRGGSKNATYFLGGGHMNQTGIIEGSGFKRYSLNTNLTTFVTDRFQINMAINAALTEHDRKAASAPYFADPPGIIYSAMTQSPVVSPYLEDGVTYDQTVNSHNQLGGGTTTTNHPLAVKDFIDDHIMNNRIFGSINATYKFFDDFKFKTLLGFDLDELQRSFYQGTQLYYRGGDPRPIAQADGAMSFNWLWENTIDYVKEFNSDNKLTAIIGFTTQKQRDERNRVVAEQFPDDQVKTVNGGIITGGSHTIEEWSLVSFLARLNYVLKNRYLLTATIRSDRSSRFGADHQTGIFPSFSIGWLLHNEGFMQGQDVINQLKPRISYGVTGNFLIPNYGSIGLLTSSNYVLGGSVVSGAAPISFSNRELTWETTGQFNIGLDYAFLENRIYGTFDWYRSHTTDLLLNVNIPSVSGFTSTLANIGEVENKGFEVQISSRNLVGKFQWTTDFNFSTNKNEVLALGPEGDPILVNGAAGLRHITKIGDPIGSYYGYQVVGIFQTQEEIDGAPEDTQGNPSPGDFQFKDVDGDGFITPDDRTVIGSYHPDFVWGINNAFVFKNFDFAFFINGVEGREVLNLTRRHLANGEANFNSYAILNERWKSPEDPGNGMVPKADRTSDGNVNRPSSYQIEDGSYIKLRNISLGYNLPKGKLPVQNLRVFASVTNVAIWTDYIGFNPEVNLAQGASLTPGEDYGAYPLSRAFQFGVDVTF
jgi:TonB-linked SusC/RagA family outer membrane protein